MLEVDMRICKNTEIGILQYGIFGHLEERVTHKGFLGWSIYCRTKVHKAYECWKEV